MTHGQVTTGLVDPFGYGFAYPDWIDLPTPAAGGGVAVAVDGAWSMRVVAARATITTDANVANRMLSLDYINARSITVVRNGAAVVVTASTTNQAYEWSRSRSVSEWATNTPVYVPLLGEILPPGFSVKFQIDNVQAGDQLTGIHLAVEKFPTGARGYPQGAVPKLTVTEHGKPGSHV